MRLRKTERFWRDVPLLLTKQTESAHGFMAKRHFLIMEKT